MRAGRVSPRVADAVLAVAAAVATVAAVAIAVPVLKNQDPDIPRSLVAGLLAVAVIQCAPLLLWRVRPMLGFVLAELCQLAVVAVLPQAQFRGLPSILLAYSLGSLLATSRAATAIGVAIVAEVVTGTVAATAGGASLLSSGISALLSDGTGLLLPFAVGIAVSSRTATARLLHERAVREQERHVDAAVAEERRRIAGELHDVAAHHLSGMVVQAAAIERMIDRDPAAAKLGTAQLRTQGKQTLNGLRSVVGLLRADGDIAAVPGLRDLPELIASTRTLGVDATLRRCGAEPELAPIVDAAVYRIAQQAISNAMQHAPGAPIQVELNVTAEELSIRITNGAVARHEPRGGTTGGTGLVVMRERAGLIGGVLDAGPATAGGWRVALTLPLAAAVGVAR